MNIATIMRHHKKTINNSSNDEINWEEDEKRKEKTEIPIIRTPNTMTNNIKNSNQGNINNDYSVSGEINCQWNCYVSPNDKDTLIC